MGMGEGVGKQARSGAVREIRGFLSPLESHPRLSVTGKVGPMLEVELNVNIYLYIHIYTSFYFSSSSD